MLSNKSTTNRNSRAGIHSATVRGNGYNSVSLEQQTDDPLACHRRRLNMPIRNEGEDEEQAGEQVENGLVHDENVDVLAATLAGTEQCQ